MGMFVNAFSQKKPCNFRRKRRPLRTLRRGLQQMFVNAFPQKQLWNFRRKRRSLWTLLRGLQQMFVNAFLQKKLCNFRRKIRPLRTLRRGLQQKKAGNFRRKRPLRTLLRSPQHCTLLQQGTPNLPERLFSQRNPQEGERWLPIKSCFQPCLTLEVWLRAFNVQMLSSKPKSMQTSLGSGDVRI